MKSASVVIPAAVTAAVLAAGAGVLVENNARHAQADDLRTAVTALVPDATVDRTDIHGFPQVLDRAGHRISTAYVDLTADGQSVQWIVQDYSTDTRQLGLLDMIVPVSVPGTVPTPVRDADGAFSRRGTVDGATVTYDARLDGTDLVVTADGDEISRRPLPGADTGRVELDGPFVSDDGLRVALTARNLTV